MDILKIIGIGLAGSLLALVLKEHKPSLSVCVSMVTALVIFSLLLSELTYVIDVIHMVADRLSLLDSQFVLILRIIGISYLTQFGSELSRDAGQNAVAQKIDLAGKILIVAASIPILTSVLNLLIGILPS